MSVNMITSGTGDGDETLISYRRADRSRGVDMARRIDGRRRAATHRIGHRQQQLCRVTARKPGQ